MLLKLLNGYPDFVGKRATFAGYGNGPASYNATTGDIVELPMPNWYIDAIPGGFNSVSGNYFCRTQPVGTGPRQQWALFWYTAAGTPVAAAFDLAAEWVQFGGFCGQY